eukprot:evm.model.scf_2526.2 EVM.evm.TU.scf_2526.2   scf_2526:7640-12070(-)
MRAFAPHRPSLLTALRRGVQLPPARTVAGAPSPEARLAPRAIPRRLGRRGVVAAKAEGPAISAESAQLEGARDAVAELIRSKSCNPILVRLAWHDAGTYNKDIPDWPQCGGANGSIRFKPEIDHGANAGLAGALKLLDPIKEQFPEVSHADLFQMASALAIEMAGGPKIPLRYGRIDTSIPEECPAEGNLPAAAAPFDDGSATPADHIRKVFYRMGLSDKDIVALSGAHTLGRAYPSRSGFGKDETKYTKDGPGTKGGSSWTPEWLKFDNSYFVEVKSKRDEDLVVLPTDAALFEDEGFRQYAEKYAEDQNAFFADYAESHVKLSELGAKFSSDNGSC